MADTLVPANIRDGFKKYFNFFNSLIFSTLDIVVLLMYSLKKPSSYPERAEHQIFSINFSKYNIFYPLAPASSSTLR